MKVNQRLKINAVVLVIMALIVFLVLSLTLHRIDKANKTAKIAGDITLKSFERTTFGNDYLRNNNERAKIQWFAVDGDIGKILRAAPKDFQSVEDKKTIDELSKNNESIGKIFSAIVKNREKTKSTKDDAVISEEVEDRLLSQMNIKVYQNVLYGRELLESSRMARASIILQAGVVLVCSFLVLLATVIINSWTMGRAITDRVGSLRDGASLIGEGDLDHRIDIKGDDEFAELSNAFNTMTAKLQGSHRDLEKEIGERRQAQEALLDAHDKLELRIEERTKELKDAEKALRQINEGLEQRVAERTAELQSANATLIKSRRAALSLMEDALAARKQAEDANAELRQEVTVRLKAEEALRESEERVRRRLDSILSPEGDILNLELADIIDVRAIQLLMEDFYRFSHITLAILDLKGNVLVGVGWQEICTKFHRLHPETRKNCIDSDTQLSDGISAGEFRIYKCKNNMWDVATPIMIGGNHVGNIFTGQFFFEDESPDRDIFRAQARQYGFDEKEYMAAFEKVPRLNRDTLETAMAYLIKFADMVSKLSYSNIKLARSLTEREVLTNSLKTQNIDLERVNKEMESFIYSISHDLRAPLRSIAGFIDFLAEDYSSRLDAQGQDYLARIYNSAEKMSRLIEDLLYLSNISRQEVRRDRVDMSKMASAIVSDLREADPERTADVRITEGLAAFADRRLIGIVLSNLLGNAWKFTSKTERAVIEFGVLERDGKTVYYVRDNGAGFDPQYAKRMFLPFHRLHPEEEFPGTGIGLTIVERIIHSHGGSVWAEGERGKGAKIFFTLG